MVSVKKYDIFEVSFSAVCEGNPFTDVTLTAQFSHGGLSVNVHGFYDGNDTWRVRFMPQEEGEWSYATSSNFTQLNQQKGNFICIAAGVSILADGLFKIQIAIDARRFGIRDWWLILLLAVVTGGVGLLLVFRPWESVQVLTVLLGAALLAEGVLNLCVALSTVKIVKNQRPDVIETEYFEVREYR